MATRETNEELLDADRSRFYTPVAEKSSASAEARGNLIRNVGELGVELDRMRSEAQFEDDLEAVRGAATAAGTAFDIEAGVQEGSTEDVFSTLQEENPAAYDELKQFYGSAEELRQAFRSGNLSGSQFEQRLDTLYRQAAARRPGYRDNFRRQASQFLGYDPGAAVNRRIFGFGTEEKDDPYGKQDRANQALDWLLENRSNSIETAEELRRMRRYNPEYLIDLASREQTSVNKVQEQKNALEYYQKNKAAFSDRLESYAIGGFSEQLDTALLTTWAGAQNDMQERGVQLTPEGADGFMRWYEESAPDAIAQYEAMMQNPEAMAIEHIRKRLPEGMSIADVNPQTIKNVTSQIANRAQQNIEMLRDPAYVAFISKLSEGRIASEQSKLLNHDTYLRFRALWDGVDIEGVLAAVSAQQSGTKLVNEVVGPYLNGDLNADNDPDAPDDIKNPARNITPEALFNWTTGDGPNPFEDARFNVDQNPNIEDKDKAKSEISSSQVTVGVDTLNTAPIPGNPEGKQIMGDAYDKVIIDGVDNIVGDNE